MSSLFESGIYNFMIDRRWAKRLYIEEDDSPETISITYFNKIIIIYSYSVILMLSSLFIEIYYFHYN